jgi:hypothetical protein
MCSALWLVKHFRPLRASRPQQLGYPRQGLTNAIIEWIEA